MIAIAVALVLSQAAPYNRTRTDLSDPKALCLYWPQDTEVVFHSNDTPNPETGGAEYAAFSRSIDTWNTQLESCSSLRLVDGPKTSSRATEYVDGADNLNVVVYRSESCAPPKVPANAECWDPDRDDCGSVYDCWQHSESAIAITTTNYLPSSGRILDSDIEFNVKSFYFTATEGTVPCPSSPALWSQSCVVVDVENTATHELGHALGLSHSASPTSTMYYNAPGGETQKRVLDNGSKRFACDVYPPGEPAKQCQIFYVTDELELGKVPSGTCAQAPALWLTPLAVLLWRRRKST